MMCMSPLGCCSLMLMAPIPPRKHTHLRPPAGHHPPPESAVLPAAPARRQPPLHGCPGPGGAPTRCRRAGGGARQQQVPSLLVHQHQALLPLLLLLPCRGAWTLFAHRCLQGAEQGVRTPPSDPRYSAKWPPCTLTGPPVPFHPARASPPCSSSSTTEGAEVQAAHAHAHEQGWLMGA